MISKGELWEILNPRVQEFGLMIYDLEVPGGQRGILRIYIARRDAVGAQLGVTLEDCAKLSKSISNDEGLQARFSEDWLLEVSSPRCKSEA